VRRRSEGGLTDYGKIKAQQAVERYGGSRRPLAAALCCKNIIHKFSNRIKICVDIIKLQKE